METYNFKEYFEASKIVNQFFINLENNTEYFEDQIISKQKIDDAIKYGKEMFENDLSFILKFSVGISGLYGPLKKFYSGQGISFTDQELILLASSMLGTLTKEDLKQSKEVISKLFKGKNKAKKLLMTSIEILKGLMKKLQGQQMIVTYAIMLVPIMEAIEKITGGNISQINATTIKNIILGMSINFGIYAGSAKMKSIFNSLKNKLYNK